MVCAALLLGHEWNPHPIEGWTPDVLGTALNRSICDEVVTVTDLKARDVA